MHLACDAEIDKLYEAIWLEHNVGGLHVAVDDRRRAMMQVAQGVAQLKRPIDHVVFRLRARCCDDVFERAPLDVVHDDEERALVVDDIDDARNRGMVETLDHVRFGHDALDDELALSRVLDVLDLFSRPLLVEHGIEREIHGRHAATANHGEKSVPLAYNALGIIEFRCLNARFPLSQTVACHGIHPLERANVHSWDKCVLSAPQATVRRTQAF